MANAEQLSHVAVQPDMSTISTTRRTPAWKGGATQTQTETVRPSEVRPMPKPGNSKFALAEIEPWPEPVDGASLLEDMTETLRRHLALPSGAAEAMALWAVHTHAFDLSTHSPRLLFTSPEPGCGKTVAMTLLRHACANAEYFTIVSEAALLRYIDENDAQPHPLLIDEADTFFADKPKLRSVLNATFERGRALISVPTDGGGWEASVFLLRAPVAIAGIGRNWTWAALLDRAIEVKMRKPRPSDQIAVFRPEDEAELAVQSKRAAQWVKENADALRTANPPMPDGIVNRNADKWRPLLAIADVAGGRWPGLAREVCKRFVGHVPTVSSGVALIVDCAAVFDARGCDALFTEDLLNKLNALPRRPWAQELGGFPLGDNALSRLLRPFEIEPARISFGGVQRRGYRRAQFDDAQRTWGTAQSKAA